MLVLSQRRMHRVLCPNMNVNFGSDMETKNMPTAVAQELSSYPLQFMVTMPVKRGSSALDRNESPSSESPEPDEDFGDPDYMMPAQVREILQQEGFSKLAVDVALGERELLHKKARYMTHLESIKG